MPVWPSLKMSTIRAGYVNMVSCHECTVLAVLWLGTVTHDGSSLAWHMPVDHFWWSITASWHKPSCWYLGRVLPSSIWVVVKNQTIFGALLCQYNIWTSKSHFPGRWKKGGKNERERLATSGWQSATCAVSQHESNIHEGPQTISHHEPPVTWLHMSKISYFTKKITQYTTLVLERQSQKIILNRLINN